MRLLVDAVRRAAERGRIPRADLEAALSPEQLRVLDQPVLESSWYPVSMEDGLLRLLQDKLGSGNKEFLVESGRRGADYVISTGIYKQLSRESALRLGDEHFGRFLITVSGVAHNFTRWEWSGSLEQFRIDVRDAEHYTDAIRYAAEGFIERCVAHVSGRPVSITSDRPAPDHVVFQGRAAAAGASEPPPARTVSSRASSESPSTTPGIKGSVFSGLAAEVIRLRDEGRVTDEQLELRLGADGTALLESKIMPSSWYPIEVYGRLRELLRDVDGGGDDQYTVASAARTARRLIESGLYQQLNYLERWQAYEPSGNAEVDAEQRRRLFRKQLTMVSTLYNSLYNFGTQKITADPDSPDRFQLEYWDDGVMPPACRFAVLGFWNEMGVRWSSSRRPGLWRLEGSADHYLLRMTRDVADL